MEGFILNDEIATQDELSQSEIDDAGYSYDIPQTDSPVPDEQQEELATGAELGDAYGDTYTEDRNNDGLIDMVVMAEDTNGDGVPDHVVAIYDNDFDGREDLISEWKDTDGDGMMDTIVDEHLRSDGSTYYKQTVVDANADGNPEIIEEQIDTNNSGKFDTYSLQYDENGDGLIDYAQRGLDTDGDGKFDSLRIYEDTTGNGHLDTMTELFDSDGDHDLDMAKIHYDYDGDGKEDYMQICKYDPETGTVTPVNDAPSYGDAMDVTDTSLGLQFQPSENYPEDVVGDPSASMTHWRQQPDATSCALHSQMFIIEEFTGQDIDFNQFAHDAQANGWYGPGGTQPLNLNKMLDYYGIENEMSFHNDISDIEECLNEGGRVVVAVNADEYWHGQNTGDLFSPTARANHAVEVIGIDYSDPDNPMVILNDSGTPDGRGLMVPLDDFMDAWEDSACQMVKCYPNR